MARLLEKQQQVGSAAVLTSNIELTFDYFKETTAESEPLTQKLIFVMQYKAIEHNAMQSESESFAKDFLISPKTATICGNIYQSKPSNILP